MRNKRAAKRIAAVLLVGGIVMSLFFGCGEKRYKIDYDGRDWYEGAKDSYKAGEKVTLYYGMIATDTDYSFYLDGERINTGYDEERGFVIEFTMPDHDVALRCESRNSMVYVPPIEPGELLVDYYNETVATVGGDGYLEMTLTYYDPVEAKLSVYEKDLPDGEESCVEYLVPYEAVDRCMNVLNEEDMYSWDDEEGSGMTGAVIVCKFRDEDGNILRFTSENIPENGEREFEKVRSIMTEYLKEEYKTED